MTLVKTIYENNLRTPFNVRVECGKSVKIFEHYDEDEILKWLTPIWKQQLEETILIAYPAFVYFNLTWDFDHILYCKYECNG